MERKCDNCGKLYLADDRNVKRGWGLCCSKSCAASKREKSKPNYNPERVIANNVRRENWNVKDTDDQYGQFKGRHTSEGYRIYGTTAMNEWGEPVYEVDDIDDIDYMHPHDSDNF